MNMMMNGNTPMNSGANRFSAAGLSSTYLSRIISTEGTAISITMVRGSCRSWVEHPAGRGPGGPPPGMGAAVTAVSAVMAGTT